MPGAGSAGINTGSSESGPWPKLQPHLSSLYDRAETVYNQNLPEHFKTNQAGFTGEGVAKLTPQQYAALSGFEQMGKERGGVAQEMNDYLYGGLKDGKSLAKGTGLEQFGPGSMANRPGSDFYNPLESRPWHYSGGLEREASGGMMQNPYLGGMYDQAARRMTDHYRGAVVPGLNATFGQAGRVGSGIHSESLTDAGGELAQGLGNLGAQIYGGAYEGDRNRQYGASSQLMGYGDQERDRLYGAFEANKGRRFGAASQLADLRMQAAGMAPQAQQMDIDRLSGALMAGDRIQGQRQREVDAKKAAFDFYQNRQQDHLMNLSSILSNNAAMSNRSKNMGVNLGGSAGGKGGPSGGV